MLTNLAICASFLLINKTLLRPEVVNFYMLSLLRKSPYRPISLQMDYLNTNLKWEDFFIQESVELEEKMSGFEMDALSKSKIRLSLENNILDWKKYEAWVLQNINCTSLKEDVNENTLKNFTSNAKLALDIYSNYDFWNEDLLPVFIWENQPF